MSMKFGKRHNKVHRSAAGMVHDHAAGLLDVDELVPGLPVQLDTATRGHFRQVVELARGPQTESRRGIASGDWVLEEAGELRVIWGTQEAPLAVEGEGFMIVGPQGVGKTTIGQQLTLALAGIRDKCLALPVRRERGKVLYLAMDRPEQIKRCFQRMVTEDDRALLAERIVFWRGPLDFEPLKEPERMAQFALEHGATHIVVDSYKDMALHLSDDVVGGLFNKTVQVCVAEGLAWTGLHHGRKPSAENKRPDTLGDVYGSVWLTSGLGSVLSLYGEAGDEVVEAKHLKQPAESFGTFHVRHDHATGRSWITDDELPVTDGRSKGKAARQARVEGFLADNPGASAATIKEALNLSVDIRTVQLDIADVRDGAAREGFVSRVSDES